MPDAARALIVAAKWLVCHLKVTSLDGPANHLQAFRTSNTVQDERVNPLATAASSLPLIRDALALAPKLTTSYLSKRLRFHFIVRQSRHYILSRNSLLGTRCNSSWAPGHKLFMKKNNAYAKVHNEIG
jgi:hypothetical protein